MRLLGTILAAGLIAGTIDIGAASLINLANPLLVMRAVASGIYGRDAFQGGLPMSAIGMVLQWGMSFIIAAIYVGAAWQLPVLRSRWILGGLAYGVGIYLVMNFVVVPLSAAPFGSKLPTLLQAAEDMVAMLVFGLIVAGMGGRRMGMAESS